MDPGTEIPPVHTAERTEVCAARRAAHGSCFQAAITQGANSSDTSCAEQRFTAGFAAEQGAEDERSPGISYFKRENREEEKRKKKKKTGYRQPKAPVKTNGLKQKRRELLIRGERKTEALF